MPLEAYMKLILRFAVLSALVFALITADLTTASAAGGFMNKAEMLAVKNHIENDAGVSQYIPVQGACTDGTYAYFAMTSDSGNTVTITKYSMSDWKPVDKQSYSNVGHANDMTYNPDKGWLVIVKNKPYYNRVAILNAKTLEVIRDVTLKEDIYSIAYNTKRKQYVVGLSGSYDFALLDQSFKTVKKFKGENTGYTRQGCDCDDNYIYFPQSGGNNLLAVYDYSGNLAAKIPLTDNREVENLFHVGSSFYTSLYYYGSYVYRLGFSSSTKITYPVEYDPNGGYGEMKPTYVHYGEKTPLRKNTFTRIGYHFGGWIAERESDGKRIGYKLGSEKYEWLSEKECYNDFYYRDEQKIATTVRYGGVKLRAMWIADRYEINFDSGEGDGYIPPLSVGYDEMHLVPESTFIKDGFVFDGFTASRDYDGRVYGYRAASNTPEWLDEKDVEAEYVFEPGDRIERLTYAGRVTMTAHFKYAYTFSQDHTMLLEYSGVDNRVRIPDNGGALSVIDENAIADNDEMTELCIPASVLEIRRDAIVDCPRIREMYFRGSLPENLDDFFMERCGNTRVYRVIDDHAVWVGFYSSPQSLPLLRYKTEALDRNYRMNRALEKAKESIIVP